MIKVTPNIRFESIFLSFFLLTIVIKPACGQILPSQRSTNWSMVGAECAIYTDTLLLSTLGIDATGNTDCSALITSSFSNLPATGGVVVFPNGTFKINAALN